MADGHEVCMKQILARPQYCVDCRLCQVHCQVEHSKSKDMIKAFKRETTRPIARVRVEREGPESFAVSCRHCAEPICVYSCLTGAMRKDPVTGTVSADPDKCVGCWTCLMVCPYSAVSQDKSQHRVVKCDMCPQLKTPACVAACPNKALVLLEDKQ